MLKRIGLTGAHGHLGSQLLERLLEVGYELKVLVRSLPQNNEKVKIVIGDILNHSSVTEFVSACDIIIHSAAIISIDGDRDGMVQRTNVEGTRLLLNEAIKQGVKKFFYISSSHAVLEELSKPTFDETNPYKTEKNFSYDWSKAQAEQLVRKAYDSGLIQGSILRPSSIVGAPDHKPSKLGQAIKDLYRGKIPVLPPGGYNFIDLRDLCDAIMSCLEKGRNGEVYLLSGTYFTMAQFAELIAQAGGKKPPRLRMSFGLMKFLLPLVRFWASLTKSEAAFTKEMLYALKNGHPHMDNSKALSELGLKPRPLQETIVDFIAWQKQRGNL